MENTMFRNVENKGLDCRLFGYICDLEGRGGFYDLADIYLAMLGDGEAQMEMPVAAEHLNKKNKVYHSAVTATADAAMEYAVYSRDKMGHCVSCEMEFVQSAQKQEVVIAVAKVIAQKETVMQCEVTVKNQHDTLLAYGKATYMIDSDFVYTYADYLRSQGEY